MRFPYSDREEEVARRVAPREICVVEAGTRHVLVDGHNVLHAWGWAGRGDLAAARHQVIAAIRTVHEVEGVDVTVVFDGGGKATVVDAAESSAGFVVQYAAADLTADGVLERLATGDARPGRCVLVSGDSIVRGNVLAAGGECLAPADLRSWIERCTARTRHRLQIGRATDNPFGNRLPL